MISLILTIALLGLITWVVTNYVPMPGIFKTIILVIVAIVLILYLMQVFGISDIPIPRAR